MDRLKFGRCWTTTVFSVVYVLVWSVLLSRRLRSSWSATSTYISIVVFLDSLGWDCFCALARDFLNMFSGLVVFSCIFFLLFGSHSLGVYTVSICCRLHHVVLGFNRCILIRSLAILIGYVQDLFMLFVFNWGVEKLFPSIVVPKSLFVIRMCCFLSSYRVMKSRFLQLKK